MLKPYNRADLHFRLDKEIGAEGKNSKVYAAHDPQLDANIVIKQVLKSTLSVEEYFRESGLLYASSHPNVVPVLYACQDKDHIYLALPLFKRGSLKALMSERALTVREMIVFSTQMLSGLHNIHSKGLVHFDLKPDNVLISDRGEALLSDFGLAKMIAKEGVAAQNRIYVKMVPPEAFEVAEFDHRFDIYQFGLTLYRMAVGESDFNAQFMSYIHNDQLDQTRFKRAVMDGRFPDQTNEKYLEHIPARIISIIQKCLKVDAAERYQSAIEIVNDLATVDGNQLDWRFTSTNDERAWSKNDGKYELRIVLDSNSISTAHKNVVNGAPRRIADYCNTRLSRSQIKKFLREF
ncbi:serine/threonine protein kinase [Xanthomonas sp. 3272]|uniref:serine/threonine-protein kinase n=1 Tax=Xanthomonas arboricola TaxID=56448 RepID=UPI001431CA3B|nr:serine/threonine-protein kinase [Xanthomonas arboricola]NJC02625.1 serine/threonine protein kinase [Xanthomonas arboricola]